MYEPLTTEVESYGKQVVDIAFRVHTKLGPGLLESIYEKCFCFELEQRGVPTGARNG
ncbi:MAG: GxxExxY protein [Flaviaesturariibacter sp.]|nr:GxxExxY protein [Flaviaesturariibacter sp.]